MKKQIKLTVTPIELDSENSMFPENAIPLTLKPTDKLEESTNSGFNSKPKHVFALESEDKNYFPYISEEWRSIYRPIFDARNFLSIGIVACAATMLLPIMGIIGKGWRYHVTRRVAINNGSLVPSFSDNGFHLALSILKKGMVLSFMRALYFIPLVIVSVLNGGALINIGIELLKLIYEEIWGNKSGSYFESLLKILPEFGLELLIQLVAIGLYVLLVWPIYRLQMMRYAIREISGSEMISPRRIYESIRLFRKYPDKIYGIYAFTLSIDVLIASTSSFLFLGTLGLSSVLLPTFFLLTQYWVKGYAYGILGARLLKMGEITSPLYKPSLSSTTLN